MKAILMVLTLGFVLNANAKLSDFNDLIEENSKAQNDLHASLTENMKDTQVAVQKETRERFLVDSSSTINAPTKKSFLTFSKEKDYHRASEKQAQKRLAVEVDSAE
ncbi:MAG: hypothetical protein H7256_11475 [Bdellovibrio sp.]|nr:hypothetical protein [Bdellovibrio sp.]